MGSVKRKQQNRIEYEIYIKKKQLFRRIKTLHNLDDRNISSNGLNRCNFTLFVKDSLSNSLGRYLDSSYYNNFLVIPSHLTSYEHFCCSRGQPLLFKHLS